MSCDTCLNQLGGHDFQELSSIKVDDPPRSELFQVNLNLSRPSRRASKPLSLLLKEKSMEVLHL